MRKRHEISLAIVTAAIGLAAGQLTLRMIGAAGVDLHAPSFFTAGRNCIGVTHGAITVAKLAAAVNGPH